MRKRQARRKETEEEQSEEEKPLGSHRTVTFVGSDAKGSEGEGHGAEYTEEDEEEIEEPERIALEDRDEINLEIAIKKIQNMKPIADYIVSNNAVDGFEELLRHYLIRELISLFEILKYDNSREEEGQNISENVRNLLLPDENSRGIIASLRNTLIHHSHQTGTLREVAAFCQEILTDIRKAINTVRQDGKERNISERVINLIEENALRWKGRDPAAILGSATAALEAARAPSDEEIVRAKLQYWKDNIDGIITEFDNLADNEPTYPNDELRAVVQGANLNKMLHLAFADVTEKIFETMSADEEYTIDLFVEGDEAVGINITNIKNIRQELSHSYNPEEVRRFDDLRARLNLVQEILHNVNPDRDIASARAR